MSFDDIIDKCQEDYGDRDDFCSACREFAPCGCDRAIERRKDRTRGAVINELLSRGVLQKARIYGMFP